MSLIDDVIIKVEAGKGGDGASSFKINFGSQRRVPDGGNGGNGGSVYFEGTHNLKDLSEFRYKKNIKAPDGVNGSHKSLHGKKGEDIFVKVPLGTRVINKDNDESFEIINDEEKILIAKGGRKGLGNNYYKIDRKNFKPARDKGEPGESFELHLILNIIADIGLVGLPNAGKSSLLSKLSNATPKIGNYPFTTLEPNLGVFENLVIADIPGLIEGAHTGRGLGISFLKHITKTKMLIHLIDATSDNPLKDYNTIVSEFTNFSEELNKKPKLVLLTKTDLIEKTELKQIINSLKSLKQKIYTVSIYDPESLENFKKELITEFEKLNL